MYGVESDELIQSKNGSLRNRNNAPNNEQPLDSLDEALGTVTAWIDIYVSNKVLSKCDYNHL